MSLARYFAHCLACRSATLALVPLKFSLSENFNGAFTALLELYFKNDLSLPRLGALAYFAGTVRPCWGKAHLAPALAGRLPANFNACAAQQGLRLVRAAAAPRVLTDKLQHVKNRSFQKKFVRYAATNSQNTALDAALLRLSR